MERLPRLESITSLSLTAFIATSIRPTWRSLTKALFGDGLILTGLEALWEGSVLIVSGNQLRRLGFWPTAPGATPSTAARTCLP